MPGSELYRRLKAEIDKIPVVDMHEHLALAEEDYLEKTAASEGMLLLLRRSGGRLKLLGKILLMYLPIR